jgi:prevent-host-death family protein
MFHCLGQRSAVASSAKIRRTLSTPKRAPRINAARRGRALRCAFSGLSLVIGISTLRQDIVHPRRLRVAEAKAKLSEAIRSVRSGPSIIHNRGRDVAVLIDVEQ